MKYNSIANRKKIDEIYDRAMENIRKKYSTDWRPSKIDERIKMIEKTTQSRVLKRFIKKFAFRILLPLLILVGWVMAAFFMSMFFGIPENTAVMISALIFFGIPGFTALTISFYRESKKEVSDENKKLMNDLRGNF